MRSHLSEAEDADLEVTEALVALHFRIRVGPLLLSLERVQFPESPLAYEDLNGDANQS